MVAGVLVEFVVVQRRISKNYRGYKCKVGRQSGREKNSPHALLTVQLVIELTVRLSTVVVAVTVFDQTTQSRPQADNAACHRSI